MAQELVRQHPDSLAALSILADTAERQNLEEAVAWRERIARLLPKDSESQLNLASAALRFGKLELAREALDRVPPSDRGSAAFHVVSGWLARAEGNFAEQEEQFAAAVKEEPGNDLYQFDLAALQIRSKTTEKSKTARETLERLTSVAPYELVRYERYSMMLWNAMTAPPRIALRNNSKCRPRSHFLIICSV